VRVALVIGWAGRWTGDGARGFDDVGSEGFCGGDGQLCFRVGLF
jgi:hypothetical protein